MIGYMGRRGYKIYLPSSRTFTESRDVTFEEGNAKRTRTRPDPDDGDHLDEVPFGDTGVEINVDPADRTPEPTPTAHNTTAPNTPTALMHTAPDPAPVHPIINPTPQPAAPRAPEPRQSTRNCKVTTRLLESEASEDREREG